MHYTEGTEQYYEIVDELAKVVEDSNAPVEVKKRIGDLSKRLEAIKKDYQGDTKGMNEALKQYVYQTEGVADLVGDLLADEQTITRLAQRNESFVKKLLTKIKALANKSAKVDSEATKYLNKLVKSFEKAIDNAHGGVSLNSIGSADEEKEEKFSKSSNEVFEIEEDSELAEKIENSSKSKYTVIRDYLIEKFYGQEFVMSDGRVAIMDKRDAQELSHKANKARTAQLGNLRKLIEKAQYDHSTKEVIHNKFVEFHYYTVSVKYKDQRFDLWINIGVAKNDGKNHIYSITNKKEEAPTENGVVRPVGNALQNASSTNIIPENGENVNSDERKSVQRSYNPSNDVDITIEDVQELRNITQDGKRKSINDFSNAEIQKAEKWARKFYKELGVKSPFFRAWFGDWREHDKKTKAKVVEHSTTVVFKAGKVKNGDTDKIISWGRDIRSETVNHAVGDKKSIIAVDDIGAVVENAVYLDTVISLPTSKSKMPNTSFMHSFYTIYEESGEKYLLKLYVEEALSNNEKEVFTRAYQLKDIIKVADIPNSVLFQKEGLTDDTSATVYSIADLFKIVKQYDKDFKPKPVNPLLLNEDGTPKVLYHGTNAEFFKFEKSKIKIDKLGNGFYLVDNEKIANSYASRRTAERGGTPKVMAVYLRAEKPLHVEKLTREDVKSFYTYQNLQDGDSYEDAVKTAEEHLNFAETTGKRRGWFDGDYSILVGTTDEYFKEWAMSEGYDCFIVPGQDAQTGLDGVAYVVFEPNQIKSATDNIGTFDSSNPDIRYSKKRSYNPTEDADVDDEGNVWVEDEEDGVKVIFSTPDFSSPIYEKKNAPGYRLSDTYDGDNPEAYVIEGKQNILSENSALKKFCIIKNM